MMVGFAWIIFGIFWIIYWVIIVSEVVSVCVFL